MEFRVFRNPEPVEQDDGRPKTFGRRQAPPLPPPPLERLTVGRAVRALLLGLALGALGLMLAPAL